MEKNLAPKAEALYQAVMELFAEGADLNNLTVAEIAKKAGIGKGTVYEYFDNKEEMIAEAIFYHTKNVCREMYDKLGEEKSLYGRMHLFLVTMDEEMNDIRCFVRVLQLMVGNSALSGKMREILSERRDNEVLIADLVKKIIEADVETDREKENTAVYLEMMAFSRIICYALYQFEAKERINIEAEAMREMICRDICRDVENFKAR
ncbi:MAG: TetR/AcrR family transcriptional regulator [Clostridium sp.]|nr:TetR/AcrR family transcriptional regulator [Clostridium sp.]